MSNDERNLIRTDVRRLDDRLRAVEVEFGKVDLSGSPRWSGCTCPPRRPTTEARRGAVRAAAKPQRRGWGRETPSAAAGRGRHDAASGRREDLRLLAGGCRCASALAATERTDQCFRWAAPRIVITATALRPRIDSIHEAAILRRRPSLGTPAPSGAVQGILSRFQQGSRRSMSESRTIVVTITGVRTAITGVPDRPATASWAPEERLRPHGVTVYFRTNRVGTLSFREMDAAAGLEPAPPCPLS